MPLSEHEQRLLEQMEQAMYAEDPRFASQMQGSITRARMRRKMAIGVLGLILGLALVVLGVAKMAVWLGAVGFALMVGGAAYALAPPKAVKAAKPVLGTVRDDGSVRQAAPSSGSGGGKGATRARGGRSGGRAKSGKASGQSFLQRLEARWDRRRDGDWR